MLRLVPNFSYHNCLCLNFLQIFSWITTVLFGVIMVLVGWPLKSRANLSVNQESLIIDQNSEDEIEKFEP